MVISNGSFHCGVAAVQRPTARSRADDEFTSSNPVLVPLSPQVVPPLTPLFSLSFLACESVTLLFSLFLLF